MSTRGLPAGLAKRARWINVRGKRVFGVPFTFRTNALFPFKALQTLGGSKFCMSSWPDIQGQPATMWPCNGSYNQNWILFHDGPGWGLTNEGMVTGGQNWCLDNYQGRLSDNNPQIMWPCYGSWSWAIDYSEGGSAVSSNAVMLHTNGWNGNYCVTSLGATEAGAAVEEYLCNKYSANQAFQSRG